MGKTLYHSELVSMGDVDAFIVRDVGPSKFDAKPGCTSMMIGSKTAVVTMKINGEDRIYTIENDRCGAALRGLQGQTVTIRAEGSREEATIAVFGASNQHRQPDPQPRHRDPNLPQRPQQQQQPQQQQELAPPPQDHEPQLTPEERKAQREKKEFQTYKAMRRMVKQIGLVMQECIEVASAISAEKLTTEDRRQLAITMFIEAKGRCGDLNSLPITRPETAPAQPARQPAPPPPRQQQPPEPAADDEPEDDIPF